MPTVSVLIKSFNHERYVKQAIESVLAQSFDDFEIIVTDDASTDRTFELIRQIRDPRISMARNPTNVGISKAMNLTIARARGEFLATLNSDDFMLPGRLDTQVRILREQPQVAAVFSPPLVVGENGAPLVGHDAFTRSPVLTDFSARHWIRAFFFQSNFLCASTAMVRRDAYGGPNPYDARLTNLQDYDVWLRMVCAGNSLVLGSVPLGAFRIRNGNMNMSAQRVDTLLRQRIELAQVMRRFRGLSDATLKAAFGVDFAAFGISSDWRPLWQLAELALTAEHPEYKFFALETMRELASSDRELRRLCELTGSVDVFNLREVATRVVEIEQLKKRIQSLESGL